MTTNPDTHAAIPRRITQDKRLSFKARGIAAYILSDPDRRDWSADAIAAENGCGRDTVQAGLRELEQHGYLNREQRRQRGTVRGINYTITEG